MSQTNLLIKRGERRAQEIRPARLIYANLAMPCSPGNKDFFERLSPTGGGFQSVEHLYVKILRADIPTIPDKDGNQIPITFKRGQQVQVINDDPDSPFYGESFNLTIGQNNVLQSVLLILNLESLPS